MWGEIFDEDDPGDPYAVDGPVGIRHVCTEEYGCWCLQFYPFKTGCSCSVCHPGREHLSQPSQLRRWDGTEPNRWGRG